MSSNKSLKEKMIKKYGAECWIDKLHLRPDDEPRRYTSKGQRKRMKELTFHHIVEVRNGGQTTEENGAILSEENHIWFNNQPEEIQAKLNQVFQEYKKQFNKCKVVFVEDLELPFDLNVSEFIADDLIKQKYNRAEKKREDRKLIDEYVDR